MTAAPRLDEDRGGWLTPADVLRYDGLLAMRLDAVILPQDVVAVFGAKGGGIGAYLWRRCRVAHLILVEEDHERVRQLCMSFAGVRGVEVIRCDPVVAMPGILRENRPTVAVLDLDGREVSVDVIRVLAQPNDSLEALVLIYGAHVDRERAGGLDEMLRTWHVDVAALDLSLRWSWADDVAQDLTKFDTRVYVRGTPR